MLLASGSWGRADAQSKKDVLTLYVSPGGNDLWSGKFPTPNPAKDDGPFATLEKARNEIRKWKKENRFPKGGVIVEVEGGTYSLSHPFELKSEDSGKPDAPIIYQARKGETVRIMGGKEVGNWEEVKDPAILSQLPENARGKVWQVNLKELGISDFGSPAGGGLELFFNDRVMTLARYPNEGFIQIADVISEGKIKYEGTRPDRWIREKDGWLEGY